MCVGGIRSTAFADILDLFDDLLHSYVLLGSTLSAHRLDICLIVGLKRFAVQEKLEDVIHGNFNGVATGDADSAQSKGEIHAIVISFGGTHFASLVAASTCNRSFGNGDVGLLRELIWRSGVFGYEFLHLKPRRSRVRSSASSLNFLSELLWARRLALRTNIGMRCTTGTKALLEKIATVSSHVVDVQGETYM